MGKRAPKESALDSQQSLGVKSEIFLLEAKPPSEQTGPRFLQGKLFMFCCKGVG